MNLLLSLVSQKSVWSIEIAIIMCLCNIICIGLGRYAIKIRNFDSSISILGIEGLGITELLATTSLGHIIGTGTILGLKAIGLI